MKLTRRIALAGVTALIAGGSVVAGGGSAMAATPRHHEHPSVQRAAADPWIADQLATFFPPASGRTSVCDSWVRDQIAWFESTLSDTPSR
ncbi:hypothetical protein ACH4PW_19410 [Streptomyces sp. NPDC017082]|uniref:hypothetical protein n=1 Tax=Streptomyces sp. NPDC017082 TaxID=3364974 RepID=UPI0037A8267A